MGFSKQHETEFLEKKLTIPDTQEPVIVKFWCQTNQIRPFTTRIFREADCAFYISDLTSDVKKIQSNLSNFNEMLDKECDEDIHRVLISNPSDLTSKNKRQSTNGMTVAIENRMHRFLEVPPNSDRDVTSTITDIIKGFYASRRLAKRCD